MTDRRQLLTRKPGRERPSRSGAGRVLVRGTGVFTHRLAHPTSTMRHSGGRQRAPPVLSVSVRSSNIPITNVVSGVRRVPSPNVAVGIVPDLFAGTRVGTSRPAARWIRWIGIVRRLRRSIEEVIPNPLTDCSTRRSRPGTPMWWMRTSRSTWIHLYNAPLFMKQPWFRAYHFDA